MQHTESQTHKDELQQRNHRGTVNRKKKGKRKVQGVPQEEETDKSKQTQIEQTYEQH